jgi:hypothetical protein
VRPFVVAAIVAACLVPTAQSGIYSPDEAFNFEIDADGFARPIQYSGGFEVFLKELRALGTEKNPLTPKFEARVRERKSKGTTHLAAEDIAGLTADLIRLSKLDEARNLLQPLTRDRQRGGFLAYTHLAMAYSASGHWSEARNQQEMAVRYSEFPKSFGKLTKPQLTWLNRVERDFYFPFLARRSEETQRGRPSERREDVDSLFPLGASSKKSVSAIRFVDEDGQYRAGKLAPTEREKLPGDAVAIVQQLLLWHPLDARLLWLLAELYNADGDIETAVNILDDITFNMGYSNPTVIEHRRILKAAAESAAIAKAEESARQRQEQADEQARLRQADRDYQKRFWWIMACGVGIGILLVYYQFREVVRRVRRTGRGA